MSNINIASAVLTAFFCLYVVAATWRSRSAGPRTWPDQRSNGSRQA